MRVSSSRSLGDQLAVALFEHVGALVELLVALEQPALEIAELGAPGASVFLCLARDADLVILGLEDQFLLLRTGLGDDARPPCPVAVRICCDVHMERATNPIPNPAAMATSATTARMTGLSICICLPSGP